MRNIFPTSNLAYHLTMQSATTCEKCCGILNDEQTKFYMFAEEEEIDDKQQTLTD